MPEIKMVVSNSATVIETVCLETNTRPSQLVKSLQNFQVIANTTLTKMIEKSGNSGGDCMEIEDEEESDDGDSDSGEITTSPKKRKK